MTTAPRLRILAAALSIGCLACAGLGCVSPDTFVRDDGGDPGAQPGTGGTPGGGTGGTPGGGTGGTPVGGIGGRVGGQGGRTGTGGMGAGGRVIGPAANFTDNFEGGNDWISDSPTNTALNPSSSPSGDWAVVADPAMASNHVFQQRSTTFGSSNPSWSANGSVDWTDMRLQARVQFGADASSSTKITLAVRFTDDRTHIFIEYTLDGRIKIRQKSGGSTDDLITTPASNTRVAVTAGQWITLGLAVSGGTVSVYLGTDRAAPPVLTATTTGLVKGGIGVGVAQGTAIFDDVLVTPP
jgi:hypothetical protein